MKSVIPDFVEPPPKTVPESCKLPYDFFKLIVDDQFIDNVVDRSKAYAAKMNKHGEITKITPDSIRVSQAVMYITGYSTPANRKMFWERRKDGMNTLVRENITRDDFISITRNSYFVNRDEPNKEDPFWKIRPMIEQLNSKAKELFAQPENVSVDEGMIGYFGPHPLKQFIRGKPTRFGFKVWILASSDGVLLGCQPYAGGSTCLKNFGLGQGPDVVLGLAEQLDLAPGSKIYCDNLFTSMDLLDHLGEKGIGVTGTMRVNRLHDIPLPSKNKAKKDMQRGQHQATFTDHSTVVVWKDNQPVYMASNFQGAEPVGATKRYSSKEKGYIDIPQPHLNESYNKNMGGVDLLDNSEKCYAITTRIKKWWWCIYCWFLNVAMVQAWRLFRLQAKQRAIIFQQEQEQDNMEWERRMLESDRGKVQIRELRKQREQVQKSLRQEWLNKQQIPLLEFTRQVAEMIMEVHGKQRIPPAPRKSRPALNVTRLDGVGHLIKITRPQVNGRCVHCHKGRSTYRCVRCDVALHPTDCFYLYHTVE